MERMNKAKNSNVHPSIIRLEQHLADVGMDRARFLEKINIYPQKYNNWRMRGIPDSKIADISLETGLSYYYLRDGKPPKYNSASGSLFKVEQSIKEPDNPDYTFITGPEDNPEVIKVYLKIQTAANKKKLSTQDLALLESLVDRLSKD